MQSRFFIRSFMALIGVCLSASPLFAHKLLLDCRLRDDRLRVEAFYDDDTPAQQAKIVVENLEKQVIAEGLTDEKGTWNCPVPVSGEYTVRAESVGHTARETLSVRQSTVDNPSSIERKTAPEPASHEEKISMPWLKLAIGIALIAGVGALFWFARRVTPERPLVDD
jgi:hypothetical protein